MHETLGTCDGLRPDPETGHVLLLVPCTHSSPPFYFSPFVVSHAYSVTIKLLIYNNLPLAHPPLSQAMRNRGILSFDPSLPSIIALIACSHLYQGISISSSSVHVYFLESFHHSIAGRVAPFKHASSCKRK